MTAVAALDLGGSHVSAARVDLTARATEPGTTTRISFHPDARRDELLGAIVSAATSVAVGVELLGVAAPGPFDYERGVCKVIGLGKLESLYGVDLGRELSAALGGGTRISFLNDAEAFLLGEAWAGAARGYARAVGITLGTGLGSAFLADGRIVAAGPSVPPEGSLHLVPFRGVPVEEVISTRALRARHGADAAELAGNARRGDPSAVRAFEGLGIDLGEFLAPWLRAFATSCLIVGGAIANAWDLFGPTLERSLTSAPTLELIAPAANLEDAPLLGAALYAANGSGHPSTTT
jgi:predicted NBD/HSP70 family sugar kinase